MKLKRTSSTGQVEWDQSDRYSGIGQVPGSSAGSRIENARRDDRIATGIYADGIEQRIRYAQPEVLDQASLHDLSPDFYIVNAVCIREVGARSPIGQMPVLP